MPANSRSAPFASDVSVALFSAQTRVTCSKISVNALIGFWIV